jgi:hypothetical protein
MTEKDEDVEVVAHVARWASVLFVEDDGLFGIECEGASVIHTGCFEFVEAVEWVMDGF